MGWAQIPVPESGVSGSNIEPAGWITGTPTLNGTVKGIADCASLFRLSPPTLLEMFEIVSYSIAFTASLTSGTTFATAPAISGQLTFLVNDDIRQIVDIGPLTSVLRSDSVVAWANGAFVGDLVNPIRMGARERLNLQLGLMSDQAAAGYAAYIGAQINPSQVVQGYPSSISYNVIELPGARRL